ncbi:MAG: hypothetical protein K2Z25_04770 [Beijerinckiaceae bacterium]|nr:hypothetical protein [Beijerinckiaceae bacterium]
MDPKDAPAEHGSSGDQSLRKQERAWFAEASAQTRSELVAARQLSPPFERRSKIYKELISVALCLPTTILLFLSGG